MLGGPDGLSDPPRTASSVTLRQHDAAHMAKKATQMEAL